MSLVAQCEFSMTIASFSTKIGDFCQFELISAPFMSCDGLVF